MSSSSAPTWSHEASRLLRVARRHTGRRRAGPTPAAAALRAGAVRPRDDGRSRVAPAASSAERVGVAAIGDRTAHANALAAGGRRSHQRGTGACRVFARRPFAGRRASAGRERPPRSSRGDGAPALPNAQAASRCRSGTFSCTGAARQCECADRQHPRSDARRRGESRCRAGRRRHRYETNTVTTPRRRGTFAVTESSRPTASRATVRRVRPARRWLVLRLCTSARSR